MNYPWDILNIERTTDLKSIKRAYAKLLRDNKPDENPAGFTQLNEAYQQAISLAKDSTGIRSKQHTDSYFPSTVNHTTTHGKTSFEYQTTDRQHDFKKDHHQPNESFILEFDNTFEPVNDHSQHTNDKWDDSLAEIIKLIEAEDFNIDSWQQALNKPHIYLAGNFLNQVSLYIFDAILAEIENDKINHHKSKPDKKKNTFDILIAGPYHSMQKSFLDRNITLLLYYDELFNWTSDWKGLGQRFGEQTYNVIDEIESAKNKANGTLDKWAEKIVAKEIGPFYDIVMKVVYFIGEKLDGPKNSLKEELIQGFVAMFVVLTILVFILLFLKGLIWLLA